MTDFSKDSDMFIMFGDLFKFTKDNYDFIDSDEYWDKLKIESDKFINKFKNIGLAKEFILAFEREQERRRKYMINNKN